MLEMLYLDDTWVSDAGCAALAAALGSGALPALEDLALDDISASAAAIDAVREALERSRAEALALVERAAIAASAARELGRRRSQRQRGGERGSH